MLNIDDVEFVARVFLIIGILVWGIIYVFFAFSSIVSEKIGLNFRYRYLQSILEKDIKWFDEINSQELPTKISRDCQSIQNATGEKFIMIVNAYMASVVSFVVAFLLAWIYAFCLLIIIPFIFVGIYILMKSIKQRQTENLASYIKSGAYAEQALNAIKVVSAFGQEKFENKAYNSFLEQSKNGGVCSNLKEAFGFSQFSFIFL